MRIAIVASYFPTLSETFVLDHVTGLIDRGHEVEIYAYPPPPESEVHSAVERYNLLGRTRYRPAFAPRRARRALDAARLIVRHGWRAPSAIARSLDIRLGKQARQLALLHAAIPHIGTAPYDVVHCHFGPNGVLAVNLRRLGLLRGPIVTTFHGADLTRKLSVGGPGFYAPLFEAGELMLPISKFFGDRLVEAGCPPKRVHVHHMGVDCDRFTPRESAPQNSRPAQLLAIGRLVEKKGTEYAIRAVARLTAAGHDLRLRIVGDGELRAGLEQLVRSLDVEKAVELLGWQTSERTQALLAEADVLMTPSITAADGDMEGIPIVLMEAMASGVPVVSTRHSGIPELVEDGVSGVLVPERDAIALADATANLLQNQGRRLGIVRAARARVEAEFSLALQNDLLVEIYRGLAG